MERTTVIQRRRSEKGKHPAGNCENAKLRETARRLKDDPSAIEEIARRELGLIKPGERVFIVKDVPPAKP